MFMGHLGAPVGCIVLDTQPLYLQLSKPPVHREQEALFVGEAEVCLLLLRLLPWDTRL
jgi:hypothetical protein